MKLSDLTISKCNVRNVNPNADTTELQESIKRFNLISKLVLRKADNDKYEIIAGQRRYYALLNMHGPEHELVEGDYVVRDDIGDEEAFMLSIQENQNRMNLTPMELNQAALKLNGMGKKDKEIANILNISGSRLKRIYRLSMDKNRIPEEAQKELQKPLGEAVFNESHWDKLRNVDDQDVIQDTVDYIMKKESPPQDVPSIVKAIQKQYEASKGPSSSSTGSSYVDDGSPEATDGPIVYEHKGKLVLEIHGEDKILKVIGKGEDEEVPVQHYMEYLKHPEKFDCQVTFKLKIKSLD